MTESEVFTMLLERPELYLGHKSIERASAFLDGYRNTVRMQPDPVFREFSKWLQRTLRITQDRNWLPIIRFFGHGEADTFDLAQELWVRYLNENDGKRGLTGQQPILSPLGLDKPTDLLNKILERPALYVGRESVVLVKAFIDGYELAHYEVGDSNSDILCLGFQNWVAKRFHIETAHDWASIISFMGISEEAAFSLLRQLWKKYQAETEMSVSPSSFQ